MHLWWYNNVKRHLWYWYFNWRYPNLPRVKAGRLTRKAIKWAETQ
jgi:hypothetical protein